MATRYSSHIKSHTANRSLDVLKANRVIREVSRDLGADWTSVFRYLMKSFDKNEVESEIGRLEKHIVSFNSKTVM